MTDSTPAQPRRKLTDILNGDGADGLRKQWAETQAATEFAPLPAGTYTAHVHIVELFKTQTKGTPGVKVQFRVCDGEHVGRMVFHDCWLTAPALPQSKRDLAKLGLATVDQLETTVVPSGRIRCKLRVALRTDDSGESFNRVRSFEVIGIDEPQADPFAPTELDDPPPPPSEGGAA